ncbi:MAG: hypothetical protein ACP5T0_12270 [Verrucomicrobiia bacterium]
MGGRDTVPRRGTTALPPIIHSIASTLKIALYFDRLQTQTLSSLLRVQASFTMYLLFIF